MSKVKDVVLATALAAIVFGCNGADRPFGAAAPRQTTGPAESRGAFAQVPLASPEWQDTLTSLIAQNHLNPLVASRAYALLGVAQYRAVQRAEGAAGRGAAAAASAVVLTYLFPPKQPAFEQMLTTQREASPGESQRVFERGEADGRAEGSAIVARAQGDGFSGTFTGTIPVGPGFWVSNTSPPTVAGGQLPHVLPWFLTSANQFRPAPPPAFGSPAYLAALAEIRQISDTRTDEQIRIATFWAMNAAAVNPGEPTPPGYWVQVGTDQINQNELSEREATHVYALVAATMFDAAIGCWDGKLTYWMIRPFQADPAITILPTVGRPNHPSYPSAHSCISSSGAEVLSHFFPDQRARLDSLVTEAGLSRMYGGIHYRFDIVAGRQLGIDVARFAIDADRLGRSALTVVDEAEDLRHR